jgi:phosphonate transport system substrate-binding protein
MTQPKKRTPVLLLILLAIGPVAVVCGVVWWQSVRPARQHQKLAADTLLRTAGLNNTPVTNKLDPRFLDADGDFVADPPKDASQLIDPQTIVFCYVPSDEAEREKQRWADFTKHLARVTGKNVEYVTITSTDEQMAMLQAGKLHVTAVNTGAVPMAVNICGFVPVCMPAGPGGKGTYEMEIIVPADSPIRSISDLKGKELTLTQVGSNSGYKAPLVLLKDQHNLLPERDYLIRYSRGHEESVIGIAKKQYQAAAVANDMLKRAVGRGHIKPDQYRSIYKSEAFPSAALGYLHTLKPDLAAKVREALMNFEWKGTALEQEFGFSDQTKFAPASYKQDWDLVRRIDDAIGFKYQLRPATLPTTAPTTRE